MLKDEQGHLVEPCNFILFHEDNNLSLVPTVIAATVYNKWT